MNGLAELLLQMKNIHKKFPGVYALKNVDFDLKSGEVHALLGENGAGKSTLIKVLGGIYRAEEGKIVIQGKETLINSVADARETGISIIHQEIMLSVRRSVRDEEQRLCVSSQIPNADSKRDIFTQGGVKQSLLLHPIQIHLVPPVAMPASNSKAD